MSEDPLGFLAGDFNLYNYVKNNPLIFIDPYGMISSACFYRALHNVDSLSQWIGGLVVGSDKSVAQKRWVGYGIIVFGTGTIVAGSAAATTTGIIIHGTTILSAKAIAVIGIGVQVGGAGSFGYGLFGDHGSDGGVSSSVSSNSSSTTEDAKEAACDLGGFCN